MEYCFPVITSGDGSVSARDLGKRVVVPAKEVLSKGGFWSTFFWNVRHAMWANYSFSGPFQSSTSRLSTNDPADFTIVVAIVFYHKDLLWEETGKMGRGNGGHRWVGPILGSVEA